MTGVTRLDAMASGWIVSDELLLVEDCEEAELTATPGAGRRGGGAGVTVPTTRCPVANCAACVKKIKFM